jgi:hypothetical protein
MRASKIVLTLIPFLALSCAGSKEKSAGQAQTGTTTTAEAPAAASTQPGAASSTAPAQGTPQEAPKMTPQPGTMPVAPETLPQHVQVQHILIGFAGSVPGKPITRTKDEAKKLAYELLDRARAGENFDALVKQYTDDSPPGIYGMSGTGVTPAPGEFSRDGMVAAFGNVGFAISVGNIGIADWDPATSPYGWHIIKRLK